MIGKAQEAIDLLEGLPAAARKNLLAQERRLKLEAGQTLFEAGTNADAVYIVNKGTLAIYVDRQGVGRHLLALVGQGEVIGEMAVISGLPRSATAVAIRDCELIVISSSEFHRLEESHPELTRGLNRLLVNRLRQTSQRGGHSIEPRTNAIIPAAQGVDTVTLARRLAAELERTGLRVHIEPPCEDTASAPDLARIEAAHDLVFLCGNAKHHDWTGMCARQADRIIAVANSGGSPEPHFPRSMLSERAAHQLADLLVLHPAGTRRPSGTGRWLKALAPNRHFHLREDAAGDWQHLARVIAGTSVGLVLSGGGARAYAHVGVMRAMQETSIPIDFIGGSSMGAIIAACHAIGWSMDDMAIRIRRAFVEKNPLSDYSLPLIGLVRGKHVERLLESAFGETEIPDLWRPFFCVSTNLTTGSSFVHRGGKLREALRASISLPGILPPVGHADGVLVDGGVMDNLPVKAMRSFNNGPVIAVDVARDLALSPQWLEEAISGPLISRMLRPPMVSVLIRAGTINSEEQSRLQLEAADLVITPPLGAIEIRDWKAFDRAVEIGYTHAASVLAHEAHRLLKPRRPE
jgi:NTE family protein